MEKKVEEKMKIRVIAPNTFTWSEFVEYLSDDGFNGFVPEIDDNESLKRHKEVVKDYFIHMFNNDYDLIHSLTINFNTHKNGGNPKMIVYTGRKCWENSRELGKILHKLGSYTNYLFDMDIRH